MKRSNSLSAVRRLALVVMTGAALASCSMMKSFEKNPGGPPPPVAAKPGPAAPKPPDKGDPNQRFAAAVDQYKKNQVQEAEAAFAALTKDFPEFSGPWTNLGIIFAKSNRREQALGAMQRANSLNPKNVVALDWLGILWRQAGDLSRARQSYERALQIQPTDALAHYNLAVLLDAYLHQPREALPHYKEYERLAGKQDLRVMAWVAEIEAASAPTPSAPTPPVKSP
jgi:tetratricopeptide (TPR) repeat protein